jgi:predicted phosphohydrolase
LRATWLTDIHLNFLRPLARKAFYQHVASEQPDILLVTGDIGESDSLRGFLHDLAAIAPIYFVLGNHDFYRSSIARVREVAASLSGRSPYLSWLPAAGVVELSHDAALVGVDGWADGRLGAYTTSPVMLNDYLLIAELTGITKAARHAKLKALGDAEAARLTELLGAALARYDRVIVATHVPPFREACWHEGRISNADWLPHFSCKAVGEALRSLAEAHPHRKIRVLCGHTHGAGTAEILPNLKVFTGGAEYGEPTVQGVFELDE